MIMRCWQVRYLCRSETLFMSKIVEIKELETDLKIEKLLNVKILHRLILNNNGDIKNYQRINEFTNQVSIWNQLQGIWWKKLKNWSDFSHNKLITNFNILSINNLDSLDSLTTRIILIFCDSSVLESNILHNDNHNNDTKTDIMKQIF